VKNLGYEIRIRKVSESEGWLASHPDLTGCMADGSTPEEALASLNISRELWIKSRIATGLDVPKPGRLPLQPHARSVIRVKEWQ